MGIDEQVRKTSYQRTVRPNLEYSSSAYATIAKGNLLSSKPGTTHYHRRHEVDHEGTPKSFFRHINMSAYLTIT